MGEALRGTCGAHGGRRKDGKPCRRPAGEGTPRSTGLCSTHETTVKLAVLTAAALEVEVEPAEDWLAGISNPKKRAFLVAFSRIGTAVGAEEASGTSDAMHGEWKRLSSDWYDPLYAEAFAVAKVKAGERLEHEARRRAIIGVRKPVLYQGAQVMVEQRNPDGSVVMGADGKPVLVPLMDVTYSDTLLIALMNANLPEKFKYRHEHAGPGGGPIQVLAMHVDVARAEIREQLHRLRESNGTNASANGDAPVEVVEAEEEANDG